MAAPICTVTGFQTSGKNYYGLNRHERMALLIYLNSLELAAIGGTAYTLTPTGTLLTAAKDYNTMDDAQLEVAHLVVAANNATNAGASVPSTLDAIATTIKCVELFGPRMMEQMALVLECQLGTHKAYPQ